MSKPAFALAPSAIAFANRVGGAHAFEAFSHYSEQLERFLLKGRRMEANRALQLENALYAYADSKLPPLPPGTPWWELQNQRLKVIEALVKQLERAP